MDSSIRIEDSIITIRTPKDVVVGGVYNSSDHGKFIITKYTDSTNVSVRFVVTGFEKSTSIKMIRDGMVTDKLDPSIYGVGFMGVGEYKAKVSNKHTDAYRTWFGMIRRCYSAKHQKRNPAYIGVTVCKKWHNFQVFAEWHSANYIEGYALDKDVKQRGIKDKVYSPDTCIFVSQKDNNIEAQAKNFSFKNPYGELFDVYNLTQFCKDNELHQGHMSAVYSGSLCQHKKWTKA